MHQSRIKELHMLNCVTLIGSLFTKMCKEMQLPPYICCHVPPALLSRARLRLFLLLASLHMTISFYVNKPNSAVTSLDQSNFLLRGTQFHPTFENYSLSALKLKGRHTLSHTLWERMAHVSSDRMDRTLISHAGGSVFRSCLGGRISQKRLILAFFNYFK
jgi:hypothetical protein